MSVGSRKLYGDERLERGKLYEDERSGCGGWLLGALIAGALWAVIIAAILAVPKWA